MVPNQQDSKYSEFLSKDSSTTTPDTNNNNNNNNNTTTSTPVITKTKSSSTSSVVVSSGTTTITTTNEKETSTSTSTSISSSTTSIAQQEEDEKHKEDKEDKEEKEEQQQKEEEEEDKTNKLVHKIPANLHSKIFVGGLSFQTTLDGLKSYFSKFGEVKETLILRDTLGRSRGFGFVVFQQPINVQEIIDLGPHYLDHRLIDPKVAVPPSHTSLPINPSTTPLLPIPNTFNHHPHPLPLHLQQQFQLPYQNQLSSSTSSSSSSTSLSLTSIAVAPPSSNSSLPLLFLPNNHTLSPLPPLNPNPNPNPSSTSSTSTSFMGKSLSVITANANTTTTSVPTRNISQGINTSTNKEELEYVSLMDAAKQSVLTPPSSARGSAFNEGFSKKIFVGGLPFNCTEAILKEYFSKFGNVVDINIPFSREHNRPRGFAFIAFDTEEPVNLLCTSPTEHQIGSKVVDIKRAVYTPPAPPSSSIQFYQSQHQQQHQQQQQHQLLQQLQFQYQQFSQMHHAHSSPYTSLQQYYNPYLHGMNAGNAFHVPGGNLMFPIPSATDMAVLQYQMMQLNPNFSGIPAGSPTFASDDNSDTSK